jgi:hypothetical protein
MPKIAPNGIVATLVRRLLIVGSFGGATFIVAALAVEPGYRIKEDYWVLFFAAALAANAVYLIFVGPVAVQHPLTWPLNWSAERYSALSASILVGATAGTALGFLHNTAVPYSLSEWIYRQPEDAFLWAVVGAVIVGGTVYAWLVSR